MIQSANLGFPRIGVKRELKKATEAYWKGELDSEGLEQAGSDLRKRHWRLQQEAGIEVIPSNDFSYYDQVLDMAVMVGAVPERYGHDGGEVGLDTRFDMARGRDDAPAMEMTKWFDTNYHYIVPEYERDQSFALSSIKAIDEFAEAASLGIHTRPVLIGPVTLLSLGKARDGEFDPVELLGRLLPVYRELLTQLHAAGADWVQMDEPALGLDLGDTRRKAFEKAYVELGDLHIKIMLTTYFEGLRDNTSLAAGLPVDGLHVDLVRGPESLEKLAGVLPSERMLSLGVIDGRNIWRADLDEVAGVIDTARRKFPDNDLQIAPSCSLLHVPVDLDNETKLDDELRSWLAFAKQKLAEVAVLTRAAGEGRTAAEDTFAASREAASARRASTRTHSPDVRKRVEAVGEKDLARPLPYAERRAAQRERLKLPDFPTTTIGSFPQTKEVREARAAFRRGDLSAEEYETFLKAETERTIRAQEELGLDVLVHGEFERNDMVEYFGEKLEGFAFTRHGWVQSYGSRCVKPPVIFGDVSRPGPMTVDWSAYAQSLTDKPVKGMLTGPVTILQWSFVRDDQPRRDTARQIALAIRDEVADLEAAGIGVIQIDEPALREGLPLRQSDWDAYLEWAGDCFRLAAAVAAAETQIHTHMCYAEFNDIMAAIADMDADVISIESSRSRMELLDSFVDFEYPNEIGPGVWDIHAPRVPGAAEMRELLGKAGQVIERDKIWANPDCGLKTRDWPEVEASLANLVAAARALRG